MDNTPVLQAIAPYLSPSFPPAGSGPSVWHYLLPGVFGFLGAVIGASIGLLSSYLQRKHDRQIEDRKLLLEKAEELYGLIEGLMKIHSNWHMSYINAVGNMQRSSDEVVGNREFPRHRIKLLIELYFPKLSEHWEQFEKMNERFSDFVVREYPPENVSEDVIPEVIIHAGSLFGEMFRHNIDLQKQLCESVRNKFDFDVDRAGN